jgi:hypothetical protein
VREPEEAVSLRYSSWTPLSPHNIIVVGGGGGGAVAAAAVVVSGVGTPLRGTYKAREARLAQKFAAQDGVTFFFFPRSPCARRVWLTLLEKKIKFRPVMVRLSLLLRVLSK